MIAKHSQTWFTCHTSHTNRATAAYPPSLPSCDPVRRSGAISSTSVSYNIYRRSQLQLVFHRTLPTHTHGHGPTLHRSIPDSPKRVSMTNHVYPPAACRRSPILCFAHRSNHLNLLLDQLIGCMWGDRDAHRAACTGGGSFLGTEPLHIACTTRRSNWCRLGVEAVSRLMHYLLSDGIPSASLCDFAAQFRCQNLRKC